MEWCRAATSFDTCMMRVSHLTAVIVILGVTFGAAEVTTAASAAGAANISKRACLTFEQTRDSASIRSVDKTTCADLLLDALPANIAPSTAILQFRNNRLSFLHREMFDRLPILEEADFSHNEIVHIGYNISSSSLVNLSLSNNKLRTVPNGTFEKIPRLVFLDLSRNEIWTVFSGSFRGLRYLQQLLLRGNLINSIDPLAFAPLTSLRELDLSTNVLNTMSGSMNSSFAPSLRTLRLADNRWICDCHLLWLKEFVTERNLQYDKSETYCTHAPVTSAFGRRWFELRYAEFACQPELLKPLGPLTTKEQTIGTNVTFECLINQRMSIRWKRYDSVGNTVEVGGSLSKFTLSSTYNGGFFAALTIHRVTESDAGVYFCEAVNLAGAVAGNFSLAVRPPAMIKQGELIIEAGRVSDDSNYNDEGFLGMIQNNTVNLLALIGALIGIVIVIIILVAAIVYCVQLIAARGCDQRHGDLQSKQRKRLLDEAANGEATKDCLNVAGSIAPASITTVTVLPPNSAAVASSFEYGSLLRGKYVPVSTQQLDEAQLHLNNILNYRSDSPASHSHRSETIRASNSTLNRFVRLANESPHLGPHSGIRYVDNPYITMYRQTTACPVHGSRSSAHQSTEYLHQPQHYEPDVAGDYCPVHNQNATLPMSGQNAAAASNYHHHCPVHGAVVIPSDCSVHSFKSRSEASTDLHPLNDFQLAQTQAGCDSRMAPNSFNLPVCDEVQQSKPSAKVYIETDVDADFNDVKVDYDGLCVEEQEQPSPPLPYSTSV